MKKLILSVIIAMFSVTAANAQFGVIGGFTSSRPEVNFKEFSETVKSLNLFHFGVGYKFVSDKGFGVQPELLYQVKGTEIINEFDEKIEGKTGFLELGLGLQAGIDFYYVRPFVYAKPFAGVALVNIATDDIYNVFTDAKNTFEYGISFGIGVDLFKHVQVSFEFYKNFGKLFNAENFNDNVKSAFGDIGKLKSYSGFKFSLGLFF